MTFWGLAQADPGNAGWQRDHCCMIEETTAPGDIALRMGMAMFHGPSLVRHLIPIRSLCRRRQDELPVPMDQFPCSHQTNFLFLQNRESSAAH